MPKGKKFAGRIAGTPNKATANAREAIAAFVDHNAERLQSLLEKIEKRDGPSAAWKCIMDLIEYHVPKLARTELTGKDGAPIETKDISDLELARRLLFDIQVAERKKP